MIPYTRSTSGEKARSQITKILQRFGAEKVGFMEDFNSQSVLLAFTWRGRNIQMTASAKGWAELYLRDRPWNRHSRKPKQEYERAALEQGMVAVNSVLRDWVKGQLTAIECGLMPFEHVFLPYTLLPNGLTVAQEFTGKFLTNGQQDT